MRVRKKLSGSSGRPRLTIHKSNKHLYVQIIDDEKGVTLCGAGTFSKKSKTTHSTKSKEAAKSLGEKIAGLAKKQNVKKVVFDRGRFKYHGLIAEFAESARKQGLQF